MYCFICNRDLDPTGRHHTLGGLVMCPACNAMTKHNVEERGSAPFADDCQACGLSIPANEEPHVKYGDDGHDDDYWHQDCWNALQQGYKEAERERNDLDLLHYLAYQEAIEAMESIAIDLHITVRDDWHFATHDALMEYRHQLYRELRKSVGDMSMGSDHLRFLHNFANNCESPSHWPGNHTETRVHY